eukprot:jgi/Mesen1/9834/ME000070S09120
MGDWGWNGDSKRAREDFVGSSRRQEDAGEAFRYRQSSVMENIGQYVYYATKYHPIQAGSIDGTDLEPHDHAVKHDPLSDSKAIGNPQQTLFVGRLSPDTTEEELKEMFLKYGPIKSLRLVRDIVTGASRRYAFVVYEHDRDFCRAFREANGALDPHMSRVLVDYNRQRLMPGWIPRRLERVRAAPFWRPRPPFSRPFKGSPYRRTAAKRHSSASSGKLLLEGPDSAFAWKRISSFSRQRQKALLQDYLP